MTKTIPPESRDRHTLWSIFHQPDAISLRLSKSSVFAIAFFSASFDFHKNGSSKISSNFLKISEFHFSIIFHHDT